MVTVETVMRPLTHALTYVIPSVLLLLIRSVITAALQLIFIVAEIIYGVLSVGKFKMIIDRLVNVYIPVNVCQASMMSATDQSAMCLYFAHDLVFFWISQ
eukprot:8527562-Heterocapsa_arctica.AAC.1